MEDENLIQTWTTAWAHVRGVPVDQVAGWPRLHLAAITRETELICHDPGIDAFRALLPHIAGDPRAMLTVVGRELAAYDRVELPDDVRLDRHDETLMTTRLVPVEDAPADPGFTVGWDHRGHVATYWLETGGRIAAEGSVGVMGEHATFDAVETTPRFRRRGLGRHVMATLTDHALAAGAQQGVLAASSQGRMLYESIGWGAALQLRSFMGA